MTDDAAAILGHLDAVATFRARAGRSPELGARVRGVKTFQHARFQATYGDLLTSPSYAAAARFFLEHLYGPHDFTARDAQFARIVPAMVRLFPADVVRTVRALAELHALSERLDMEVAEALSNGSVVDASHYLIAWQGVGQAPSRTRQIELMLSIGAALARFTRNRLLRHSLRMMRGPAQAAGLGALQHFLEAGFDTFAGLADPAAFLTLVSGREREIVQVLFAAEDASFLPAEFRGLHVSLIDRDS